MINPKLHESRINYEKTQKDKISNIILHKETNKQNTDEKITNPKKLNYLKIDINNENEDLQLNNKYILDPLSVIIKLGILSKKQVGTKICIYNNTLYIQEVGIFQPLVRYLFNNNKIDIQYLYNPIQFACLYFLKKNSDQNIKNIFIGAQEGLRRLVETYKDNTLIVHVLFYYHSIIDNHLREKYNDKLFMKDNYNILYSDQILKKLNSTWNYDRIKIVLDLIDFINNDKDFYKNIKCLEEFMSSIDKYTFDLLVINNEIKKEVKVENEVKIDIEVNNDIKNEIIT